MKKTIFLFSLACFLLACNPIKHITFSEHMPFDEKLSCKDLSIAFNGTASFYIKYNNSALLTDPFMSNPPTKKVVFGKIAPNLELLEKYKPKHKDVKIVAIGHAHYDHILDLPYFVDKISKQSILVGSENVIKQAQTLNPSFELLNISALKANYFQPGKWVYSKDNSMRILAIKSAHLPHFCGIHLYKGPYESDSLCHFPVKGRKFKQDETLAYLIDFLDKNLKPAKRVYFSSSAVASVNGLIPLEVLNEKSVDLAILSVALVQEAKGYPKSIVRYIKPQNTILCHWENFFRDRSKKLKPIALTNFKELFRNVDTLNNYTNVHFIKPGNTLVLSN